MARLELTLAMTSNPRSAPVLSGATRADGVTFRSTVAGAPDIFWRQLHDQEFDVSEMSMSSLLITIARGNRDWVGLPIFTQRHFFQTWAWVRTEAGIDTPVVQKKSGGFRTVKSGKIPTDASLKVVADIEVGISSLKRQGVGVRAEIKSM